MTSPPGSVTKAVIPTAGLGTRFLPATKATPKEMLPVVDKPAIQYVVEEAVAAGLDDVLFVTGRNKRSLEDHWKSQVLADIHYVRQGDPLGLGHAVLCGARHVGDQPFAVLLGDDLIDSRDPLLPAMLDVQRQHGGSVVALIEVDPSQIHLYGCAAVSGEPDDGVVEVTDLVEKPDPAEAPSNLAIIGRYVLDPAVFDVLRDTGPGRGGEIQLTDALKTLITMPADKGGGVRAVVFRGRRYDTGDRLDYLRTTVRLAAERSDLGPEFRAWLREYVVAEMRADGPADSDPGERR